MSAGIWHRLEHLFERAVHHHDVDIRKEALMTAFTRLKAAQTALIAKSDADDAKIADLETELAAARAAAAAAPVGTSDADLAALEAEIEKILGPIPDPANDNAAQPAPTTVIVAAPTTPGVTSVPVAPDPAATSVSPIAPVVGSTVTGPGIDPTATVTVQPGSTASTLVLSDPTTAAHAGDGTETLTITPPAA